MTVRRSGFLLALLACFGCSPALADEPFGQVIANQLRFSFNPTGAGARAAGMANAFIAVSDDGTAASWNPGGLAQLRQPEFSVVYGISDQRMSMRGFHSLDGIDSYSPFRLSDRPGGLDFVSASLPVSLFEKPVTLQVGWQRMYSLDFGSSTDILERVQNPGAPQQRLLLKQQTRMAGGIHLTSLAGAIQLTQRTALGASLNFWEGSWTMDARFNERKILGGPPSPEYLSFHQSNRIQGRNFNVGILLTYPTHSVGLVYHSPFSASYRFETEVDSNIPSPDLGTSQDSTKLRFPKRLGLGVAWHPSETWTLAMDLTYNQWSTMVIRGVPGEFPDSNFLDYQPQDETATRDTLGVSAGAEYLIVRDRWVVPLRFGVAFDPQGGRDPLVRGNVNYTVLSVGTGFNTNSLKLDAALQYRWANYRTGQFMEPEGMLQVPRSPDSYGQVSAQEWRLNVSGIWRVTRSEGLGKVLHKIFVGP